MMVVTKGVLARFEVKPGREADVEAWLAEIHERVEGTEPGTVTWYGFRLGPTTFGVVDAFTDEAARDAHFQAAGSLPDIFASPPEIEMFDILQAKLP